MKKLIIMITLTALTLAGYSQKSIDRLFEKYGEKDGFVTLTINGNLCKLIELCDDDDKDCNPFDITEIRILSQEEVNPDIENFHDAVISDLDPGLYEEFMKVKESDQDISILLREENNVFKEFLFVSGGKNNVLIQLKGNMTYDEANKLACNIREDSDVNIFTNF